MSSCAARTLRMVRMRLSVCCARCVSSAVSSWRTRSSSCSSSLNHSSYTWWMTIKRSSSCSGPLERVLRAMRVVGGEQLTHAVELMQQLLEPQFVHLVDDDKEELVVFRPA